MKTGSMVTAFVNACYIETGIPIVGVSCAKGGSAIAEWIPGTAYYADAVERFNRCEKWLTGHDYRILYKGMVWCQGVRTETCIRRRISIKCLRCD